MMCGVSLIPKALIFLIALVQSTKHLFLLLLSEFLTW
jgi:hypothetical protein